MVFLDKAAGQRPELYEKNTHHGTFFQKNYLISPK